MHLLKSMGIAFILTGTALFAASCGGGHSHEHEQTEVHHGEGKEYNSDYVCPMHCEGSGSKEAGTCPVCGMDYVTQAEHAEDGHTH